MGWVVFWLFCGIIGGAIGVRKGARALGFALGVLLGPIGILITLALEHRFSCPVYGRGISGRPFQCAGCGTRLAWLNGGKQITWIPKNFGRSERSEAVPEHPNLLPCPDCGNQVSRLAAACPKCGRPLNHDRHPPFSIPPPLPMSPPPMPTIPKPPPPPPTLR